MDQFYGIELGEFPARIAETALWMMDHIMNNRLSLEFGRTYARIPCRKSPHVVHGDALEIDWSEVLPAEQCDYVLGNPPFVGAKYQASAQRAQVRRIAASGRQRRHARLRFGLAHQGGDLREGPDPASASWRPIRRRRASRSGNCGRSCLTAAGLEIAFAHRTFAWGSDARGKAHVHVVILGLDRRANTRNEKRLFSYPDLNGDPEETRHAALSPYLFDASVLSDPHLTVREASGPINGMGKLKTGVQAHDR